MPLNLVQKPFEVFGFAGLVKFLRGIDTILHFSKLTVKVNNLWQLIHNVKKERRNSLYYLNRLLKKLNTFGSRLYLIAVSLCLGMKYLTLIIIVIDMYLLLYVEEFCLIYCACLSLPEYLI